MLTAGAQRERRHRRRCAGRGARAEKLLVLTDVEGLYADWPNSSDVIGEISPESLAELIPDLSTGMIPKMTACLKAVQEGVAERR